MSAPHPRQHVPISTNRARLELFPRSTEVVPTSEGNRLSIAGIRLDKLAEQHGTPLYLYDQNTMDAALVEYRQALSRFYDGRSAVTLAGKAFLCIAAAQWAQRRGLWLDCTGSGELHIAASAAVARRHILVHGVNKSRDDLKATIDKAGVIVVDNLTELARFACLAQNKSEAPTPDLWLRIRPGLAVDTHAYRQTGQQGSKFGMDAEQVMEAVGICQRLDLPLTGLHFHQGSHFRDPGPIGPALEMVLDLVVQIRGQYNWIPQIICPGGGWGVAYHEDELPHPRIEDYVAFVSRRMTEGCRRRKLPLPLLQLEPGRSLVARAGVALYRVGAVKVAANRHWLLIDGGMSDNPRPALYNARYSALPVAEPLRPNIRAAWVAGPYCESGDVLIEELDLPDIRAGSLLAIPASGAYHLNMGSNYNGARKPAVLWLNKGQSHLIQRRETVDDLIARDLPLP